MEEAQPLRRLARVPLIVVLEHGEVVDARRAADVHPKTAQVALVESFTLGSVRREHGAVLC